MTKNTFKLGDLTIDAAAYGSQGNAILGIRDSGKTYTATEIAEKLFEAGIPFITFDPTGVWRWLRVPGKGRGYPIVVAGGKGSDLPLTVTGAVEIVRAAMKNGVSLVIDLTDPTLSKANWKRIVKDCVRALLQENAPHGLRHIFIEEAAEFVPQRVLEGDVYAEVEKLARIGGNSRLGYTLINQRSQEVNKAVLELCENLFLHRQKGKNAIQSLDHWLDVAGVDPKELIKSLPRLPSGQCWAWMGDRDAPHLIQVPPKNSFHPDRRTMHGAKGKRARKAVNVGAFVKDMKGALVSLEAEAKANDPKLLKEEIAALRVERDKLAKAKAPAAKVDPEAAALIIKKAEERGFDQAKRKRHAEMQKQVRAGVVEVLTAVHGSLAPGLKLLTEAIADAKRAKPDLRSAISFEPTQGSPAAASRPTTTAPSAPRRHVALGAKPSTEASGDGALERPLQVIINAVRWWNVLGVDAPSHAQVAFVAGYSHKSGTWATYLSRLRSMALIEGRGDLVLTNDGWAASQEPPTPPSGDQLRAVVLAKLDAPLARILTPIMEAYPNGLSHQDASERAGYSAQSGTWATYLSRLRSLDLIDGRGELKAQEWLFPMRLAA